MEKAGVACAGRWRLERLLEMDELEAVFIRH
jgi:hypothetical protein